MFILQSLSLPLWLSLASIGISAPTQHRPRADPLPIVQNALSIYQANTMNILESNQSSCTSDRILIRRAWDDLTSDERSNYIDAVKCLQTIPAATSIDLAPGARNKWDDFTYAHINQTNFAHQSGLLLPWHRQYIWAMEQTLRNDCGYTGALPYWAWERHSDNQMASPVFQPDSFGGNGIYVPHNETVGSTVDLEPPVVFTRAPGTGGGCITDGPFVNFTINLGPVSPANNPPENLYGTQFNPRCIRRDFDQRNSAENLTYTTIANLLQTTSIHDFHPLLENVAHLNSHNFVGGEIGDTYASPNDPIFYLLHAQVDRLWTVWQGLDYPSRLTALDGTLTIGNIPPSANATLDSVMHMGLPAGGDLPISHAMNTLDGDYCYIYL